MEPNTSCRGIRSILLGSVALLFSVSVSGNALAESRPIAHGSIPQKPEYWEFHRWYLNHAVVDVLINGESGEHLQQVLGEVEQLQKRGVLIRDIVVIGGNSFGMLDKSSREQLRSQTTAGADAAAALKQLQVSPSLIPLAERLSLGEGQSVADIASLLKKHNITKSPTWMVSTKGQLYLYEGVPSLSKQFSRTGEFRLNDPQPQQEGR